MVIAWNWGFHFVCEWNILYVLYVSVVQWIKSKFYQHHRHHHHHHSIFLMKPPASHPLPPSKYKSISTIVNLIVFYLESKFFLGCSFGVCVCGCNQTLNTKSIFRFQMKKFSFVCNFIWFYFFILESSLKFQRKIFTNW